MSNGYGILSSPLSMSLSSPALCSQSLRSLPSSILAASMKDRLRPSPRLTRQCDRSSYFSPQRVSKWFGVPTRYDLVFSIALVQCCSLLSLRCYLFSSSQCSSHPCESQSFVLILHAPVTCRVITANHRQNVANNDHMRLLITCVHRSQV